MLVSPPAAAAPAPSARLPDATPRTLLFLPPLCPAVTVTMSRRNGANGSGEIKRVPLLRVTSAVRAGQRLEHSTWQPCLDAWASLAA